MLGTLSAAPSHLEGTAGHERQSQYGSKIWAGVSVTSLQACREPDSVDHCTGKGRGPNGLFCAPALHFLCSFLNMVCFQRQECGDQELGHSPVMSVYSCNLCGGAEWQRTPLNSCKRASIQGF